MNTVHFTTDDEMRRTFCGKDALSFGYATDLDGPALFLAEYFATYKVTPCRACVAAAREAHERQRVAVAI